MSEYIEKDSDPLLKNLISRSRICYILLLWARDRIQEFTQAFITHVFDAVRSDLSMIYDCIQVVNIQLALLSDRGIYVEYVFQERIEQHVQLSIMQVQRALAAKWTSDTFIENLSIEHDTHNK